MIGFLKYLWMEYQCYKLGELINVDQKEKDALFMRNYLECLESGLTERQIRALMNLMY